MSPKGLRRTLRACRWVHPTAVCPESTDHASGLCEAHRQTDPSRRGTFRERGYSAEWDRRRRSFLEKHPTCRRCGAPATVADHLENRRQLVERGVVDPDADEHLIPLCSPCHSECTAKFEGGFGRPIDLDAKRRWIANGDGLLFP